MVRPTDDPAIARVVELAEAAGIASDAWLVGGPVRDLILGVPVTDVDVAVAGDAIAWAQTLAIAAGTELTERHTAFGGASLTIPVPGREDARVDVATLRTETYEHPGALPSVTRAADVADDLVRRDFTVNALAVPLTAGNVEPTDPFGGQGDLLTQTLRILHPRSFIDDPTRLLRALRYALRLGLTPDAETTRAIDHALDSGALETVSGTRIASELQLVFGGRLIAETLELAEGWGLADQLFGGLHPDIGAIELGEGALDDPDLWPERLGVTLWEADRSRLDTLLRDLGLSTDERQRVFGAAIAMRLVRADWSLLDDAEPDPMLLRNAVAGWSEPVRLAMRELVPLSRAAQLDSALALATREIAVTGDDLIALGMDPGPAVGAVLRELLARTLAGRYADEAAERADAELLAAEHALPEPLMDPNDLHEKLHLLPIIAPVLIISIILHELAHGFSAYALGDHTAKDNGHFTLDPRKHFTASAAFVFIASYVFLPFPWIWAWTPVNPKNFRHPQRDMALVALAGPLMNFLLAFVAILVFLGPHPVAHDFLFTHSYWLTALSYSISANIWLGIFNLFPIPPLDGSKIIGIFMPRQMYADWRRLDQYAPIIFLAFILLSQGQLSTLINSGVNHTANGMLRVVAHT